MYIQETFSEIHSPAAIGYNEGRSSTLHFEAVAFCDISWIRKQLLQGTLENPPKKYKKTW